MGICCSTIPDPIEVDGRAPSTSSLHVRRALLDAAMNRLRVQHQLYELLAVLAAVDGVDTTEPDGLYHPELLLEALRRYETVWLPLLADTASKGTARRLLPPIDVLFVSYAHRLDPVAFQKDCEALLGCVLHHSNDAYRSRPANASALPPLPSHSDGGQGFWEQLEFSRAAWRAWVATHPTQGHQLPEPYDPLYFKDTIWRRSAKNGFQSRLSTDVIATCIRQKDFITSVFAPGILSSLPQAVSRYMTFMVLAAIPSGEHKKIPTCDIDLVWHAHLMSTDHYADHCCTTAGPYPYEDRLTDCGPGGPQQQAFEATKQLWEQVCLPGERLQLSQAAQLRSSSGQPRALPPAFHQQPPVAGWVFPADWARPAVLPLPGQQQPEGAGSGKASAGGAMSCADSLGAGGDWVRQVHIHAAACSACRG